MARRLGEAERTETAARESVTAETVAVLLASQRISACVAIRWSLMEAGNLRRNNAKKRESGAVVSNLRESISAIIAEGRRSPRSG